MQDKHLYELAAKELDSTRDEATWIKAVTLCQGDESRAKFSYIQLRVDELSRGSPTLRPSLNERQQAELTTIASRVSISITGEHYTSVREAFCAAIKAKKFDDVLCDIKTDKKIVFVTPASKAYSGLVLAGAILGGGSGVIGAMGLGVGMALQQVFQSLDANQRKSAIDSLRDVLVIDGTSIDLKAYDYRTNWDLSGGEWVTRISITGSSLFNGNWGESTLRFGVHGKTYERSFLQKANNKVPEIAKLLGLKVPEIGKETKFVW